MNSTRPVYSIRFPLIKERTRYKNSKGRRYRIVADKTGLSGARSCAAGMINSAMLNRDHSYGPRFDRSQRHAMRVAALWARVFAGHIEATDSRIEAAHAERNRTVHELCNAAA